MAYNSFYQPFQPVNYGQQFQGYNAPPMNQQALQQMQNTQQPTIQNGGFVSVSSAKNLNFTHRYICGYFFVPIQN